MTVLNFDWIVLLFVNAAHVKHKMKSKMLKSDTERKCSYRKVTSVIYKYGLIFREPND